MKREGWRSRRRRDLTADERTLWAKVAETIQPLPGRRVPPPPTDPTPETSATAQPDKQTPVRAAAAPPVKPKAHPPLAPIEPKIARSLRRGGEVDARIDLHGLRQDQAHGRLRAFLVRAQSNGARVVLVITGKGTTGGGGLFDERGVLKRQVPIWLSEPAMRAIVLGFSEASAAHGGSGALYVRLRRER
ncbi:Smr/MutS family protein [Flaviflagellibacter deserti]|uniref:Smr/MutS family protein n=1 Tax=Flaviflagellibacter deserti TaxID=2267266 RepID=A0ABV9Z4C6_9HYPH